MRRLETLIVRFETLAVLAALAFYVWFLRRFGLGEVVAYLRLAAWGLVLTVSLESVSRLANTLGWRATIAKSPPDLRFGELLAARIAGEAIDYITPTAQLGGQPVMAVMVRRKLGLAVGLATVTIAALAEGIGQIAFVGIALIVSIPLEAKVHSLFWPAIGGLLLAISLVTAFFIVQLRRPFSHLSRVAARIMPLLKDSDVTQGADAADAFLTGFYASEKLRLLRSCFCYLAAWSMGPVEIYILLRMLHQPAPLLVVLVVEALGQLIERATFLIPAKLVSQEGGKALILATLGYPVGVGFVVGLLRRIKEMIWVLFGLTSLAAYRLLAEHPEPAADAAGAQQQILGIRRAQGEHPL